VFRPSSATPSCATSHRVTVAFALGFASFVLWHVGNAGAACCQLVRVPEEATADVRACEPDGTGGCGSVLWEAPLAPGQSFEVCPSGDLVVYLDQDPTTSAWEPPTTAMCDGSEVDL